MLKIHQYDIITTLLIALWAVGAQGSEPTLSWQATSLPELGWGEFTGAVATSDGGIVCAMDGGFIVRLAADGDTLWTTYLKARKSANIISGSKICLNARNEIIAIGEIKRYRQHWSMEFDTSMIDSMNYMFWLLDENGATISMRAFGTQNIGRIVKVIVSGQHSYALFYKNYYKTLSAPDVVCELPEGDYSIVCFGDLGDVEWCKSYRFPYGNSSLAWGEAVSFDFKGEDRDSLMLIARYVDSLSYKVRQKPEDLMREQYLKLQGLWKEPEPSGEDSLSLQITMIQASTGQDRTKFARTCEELLKVASNVSVPISGSEYGYITTYTDSVLFYRQEILSHTASDTPGVWYRVYDSTQLEIVSVSDQGKLLAHRKESFFLQPTNAQECDLMFFIPIWINGKQKYILGYNTWFFTNPWPGSFDREDAYVTLAGPNGAEWVWNSSEPETRHEISGFIQIPDGFYLYGRAERGNWLVKVKADW